MKIIKTLWTQGRTVILITHDNDIAASARRVIRISDGKIIEDFINEKVTIENALNEINSALPTDDDNEEQDN